MPTDRFPFAFDRRFTAPLRVFGVRPDTSGVFVDDASLRIVFGPWRTRIPLDNVASVQVSDDYRWFRVIGPHLSLADRGATLGTNAEAGACVQLHDPVPLLAGRWLPHPGITMTVEDPHALAAAIERRTSTPDV